MLNHNLIFNSHNVSNPLGTMGLFEGLTDKDDGPFRRPRLLLFVFSFIYGNFSNGVVSNLRRIDFEAEIKVNQEIKVKDMATEISILLLLFTINL